MIGTNFISGRCARADEQQPNPLRSQLQSTYSMSEPSLLTPLLSPRPSPPGSFASPLLLWRTGALFGLLPNWRLLRLKLIFLFLASRSRNDYGCIWHPYSQIQSWYYSSSNSSLWDCGPLRGKHLAVYFYVDNTLPTVSSCN